MVIETETEYHDMFKQIMLALFDLIRVPPDTCPPAASSQGTSTDDKKAHSQVAANLSKNFIAFADLVANIAFLKTIPAPPFNSIYNIQMLPVIKDNMVVPNALHTFTLKEDGFGDSLPNRSLTAIKVLFDVLDVRSIIYCWKALLFDKSVSESSYISYL